MTNTEATILASFFGVIGGLIGVFGSYVGARYIANTNNRKIAGIRFREAFAPERTWLNVTEN